MKNYSLKLTAAVLFMSLSILFASPMCRVSANDATVKSYEDQLEALSIKQEEALAKLNEAEASLAGALERKQIIDEYLEATMRKIVIAEAMLAELELQIAEKEEAIHTAESDIIERRSIFLDRMAHMEEDGNASFIELLLGSESLGDFLNRLDNIKSIMEYDKEVIAALDEAKARLNSSLEALEASRHEQTEVLEILDREKADFAALAAESAAVVDQLRGNAEAFRSEYDKASASEKALAAELEAYLKELESQKTPDSPSNNAQASGDFIPPLDPASGAYISSSYGWRDLFGVPDLHEATDIPVTAGTPIYASNDGVVIKSELHDSYGNYIMIDHGNGVYTLYAHMTYREYYVGQTVLKGDVIGYVGNTGNSYGAHLHFEYWIDGKRTDPELYVPLPYPKW